MNKFVKIIGAVAIINIVAKMFGFFREQVIGFQFGTTNTADSIITAYMIPNFLYLVVGGAFTTAFISVYNRKSTDQGMFVKQTFTTISSVILVLTALMLIFIDPMLHLLFPKIDGQEYILLRNLSFWMIPSTVFLVLSSWYSGLLNVNAKFHLSSIAILIYNAVFVLIALVAFYWVGATSHGLGALLSSILMVFFLAAGYRKLKTFPVGISFAQNESTKNFWIMALPIMLGGATIQFYTIIQRIFSAFLEDGYVSAVNYATKLTQFPQAILMTAVTTVIYPLLSKKVAEKDYTSIKSLYTKGLRYLIILLVPVTVFAFFYAENLVQVIYEYSNFTTESTEITAPILKTFVLTMFFLAANTYVTRFYYAEGNSYVPVIFSLINVFLINIGFTYFFLDSLGVQAIAWGTLISSATNFIMLALYAKYKFGLTFFNSGNKGIGKIVLAIMLIGIVSYLSNRYFTFGDKWLTFIVGLVVFTVSFVGSFLLFKIEEASAALVKLNGRFKRLIN